MTNEELLGRWEEIFAQDMGKDRPWIEPEDSAYLFDCDAFNKENRDANLDRVFEGKVIS